MVAVASGTAAIEIALRALHLPPGAVVLTPSLTFCGAVAAIVQAGLRPALVDVHPGTLLPTPATVAAAARRVGLPDGHGRPAHGRSPGGRAGTSRRRRAARAPDRADAAHGIGARLRGIPVGGAAHAACFSFYATKNLPIGEGGAIATDDDELADQARVARLHGMSQDAWRRYLPGAGWRYDVAEPGLKANLTDVQAAIGRAQLACLPGWQLRREETGRQLRRGPG